MMELTKLGKYDLKRELGKGSMGVVYEGFDPDIQRTVAIKTVLKSMLDSSEAQETLSRFRREAQAAGRLTHPNIVSVYEYGEDQGMAFIAMEFIHGRELKKYFDSDERFQIKDIVRIMSQLLEALDYSHNCGVVHRDIKPANIIITDDGKVKIADFGIARIDSSNLTQAGTVLGTPAYMSPEQFMGLTVDRRTDIYSSGVVLYQFLTGERPFTGSVITIMHRVLNEEPVPPSVMNFSVSSALDDVVKKAMAKRIEDRFQTAREFMETLKAAAEIPPAAAAAAGAAAPDATLVARDTTSLAQDEAPSGAAISHADLDLWKSIKNSQNMEDFQRYLKAYPQGKFADIARLHITSLEAAAKAEAEAEALATAEARHDKSETNKSVPDQSAAAANSRWKLLAMFFAGSLAALVAGAGIWLARSPSPEPTRAAIPEAAAPAIQTQGAAPPDMPASAPPQVPASPEEAPAATPRSSVPAAMATVKPQTPASPETSRPARTEPAPAVRHKPEPPKAAPSIDEPTTAKEATHEAGSNVKPGAIEPEVQADKSLTPAPASPSLTPEQKTIDEQYNEKIAKDCQKGLQGLLCREAIKIKFCFNKWSENPPKGQSICKQIKREQDF